MNKELEKKTHKIYKSIRWWIYIYTYIYHTHRKKEIYKNLALCRKIHSSSLRYFILFYISYFSGIFSHVIVCVEKNVYRYIDLYILYLFLYCCLGLEIKAKQKKKIENCLDLFVGQQQTTDKKIIAAKEKD